MRDAGFLPLPEMKARLHYVAWLAFALISFPAGGHAAILVLCVSVGEYVDQQRLLLTVLAALILGPLAYAWRKYGETHCRFAEFDDVLHRYFQGAGATSHAATLEAFIAAIDRATGLDRQLARNEAKAWLQQHGPELDSEERELVAEHLGYLHHR